MQTPNINLVSPNRPIIQSEDLDIMKSMFDICLSSNTNTHCSTETKALFDKYRNEERQNICISKIGDALDIIKTIFTFENNSDFSRKVFNLPNQNEFVQFIQYSIVDFKLNTQRPISYQPGEERTFFCEVIIPLFKSFGNTVGKICYSWCEKKALNTNYLYITNNNFNKSGVKNFLLDGIGNLKYILNYILIESSG
jgi:hypothetical protein